MNRFKHSGPFNRKLLTKLEILLVTDSQGSCAADDDEETQQLGADGVKIQAEVGCHDSFLRVRAAHT